MLRTLERHRRVDLYLVIDLSLAIVHSELGAIQLEFGLERRSPLGDRRLARNLHLNGLAEHRHFADQLDIVFARSVDRSGLEGDLRELANVKEIWILEVFGQLWIVRPETLCFDLHFERSVLWAFKVSLGFGFERLEPTFMRAVWFLPHKIDLGFLGIQLPFFRPCGAQGNANSKQQSTEISRHIGPPKSTEQTSEKTV